MQIFVNGFIAGLSIAVLALAFTIVYLSTRIFHVALGGVFSIVPFVTLTFHLRGWGWPSSVFIAILAGVLLSLACELLNHAPLAKRKASEGAHLISSLGLYIVIVQAVVLKWGSETKMLRTGLDTAITMGAVSLTRTQIITATISSSAILIFYLWLQYSRVGLLFRALADNPTEFSLRGHNIRRFRLVAFSIAGLFCSISSLLVAFDFGMNPYGGLNALLPAVVAVIIGGKDKYLGPVIGSILIGVIRAETVWFLSSTWQDTITFLLFTIFLFFRPRGLMGRKVRLEAEP